MEIKLKDKKILNDIGKEYIHTVGKWWYGWLEDEHF